MAVTPGFRDAITQDIDMSLRADPPLLIHTRRAGHRGYERLDFLRSKRTNEEVENRHLMIASYSAQFGNVLSPLSVSKLRGKEISAIKDCPPSCPVADLRDSGNVPSVRISPTAKRTGEYPAEPKTS